MAEAERRKSPRETDRLKEARDRLEEALADSRQLRATLDLIVGRSPDETPMESGRSD